MKKSAAKPVARQVRPANYRRDEKHLYLPGTGPQLLQVPAMWFAQLDGSGDPNGPLFAQAVEALYSVSYAIRMSYRGEHVPVGYTPYTVYPLEGVWDLLDRSLPASNKDNLRYTLMIRQPEFVTPELFQRFLQLTRQRKSNKLLQDIRYREFTEGHCCQALHLGPFENEDMTFQAMEQHCEEHSVTRASKLHREIYLSDPRKTEAGKLKTVLRFQVSRID